jgi:16S rRNA (adenine1518-N6/adenine1519-N6)-dimethyltransferase
MAIKTKKSLGQHFLKSKDIVRDIVLAAHIHTNDLILEIGPGEGVLTLELLASGCHVVSVEKDDRLIPVLKEKFAKEISSGQLEFIHDDILHIDMSKVPFDISRGYKVVANIPYYITGQILRMFLESTHQPESMVLLVQKEVAERIVARDKKESLLSLSVKVFGTPRIVRTVGRGAFSPQPNVDSAVLAIENISKQNFITTHNKDINNARFHLAECEKRFFELIHAGFTHKRKQLLPNLSNMQNMANNKEKDVPRRSLGTGEQVERTGGVGSAGGAPNINKEKLVKVFEKVGLDQRCRAEDVSLETWLKLCRLLNDI